MATDIKTTFDSDAMQGDLAVENGGLAQDQTLKTAILHSLFSDRRARDDDELPYPGAGRRGWWGDLTLDEADDHYGSRLWLLRREKQTNATKNRAREYALEALAWLTSGGYAENLSVEADYPKRGILVLTISVTLTDGTTLETIVNTNIGEG